MCILLMACNLSEVRALNKLLSNITLSNIQHMYTKAFTMLTKTIAVSIHTVNGIYFHNDFGHRRQ